MLSWFIQITIISIILIFLVHHLIQFFKDTLTIPKIKDLVNAPTKKYESMFLAMGDVDVKDDYTYKKSLLPSQAPTIEIDVSSMKNELKNYLKSQHTSTSTSISDLIPSSKKKIKITELI